MNRALPLLAVLALFGCSNSDPTAGTPRSADASGKYFARATPLWDDPQNAPHPAFGWPTLSNPPADLAGLPEYWQPMPTRELPQPISGLQHVAQANSRDVPSGGGIAVFGRLAVVPGLGDVSTIVDLGDPAQPRRLSRFKAGSAKHDIAGFALNHRGAATIAYPSGRLVAVFSTSTVIDVWDITDPKKPFQLPSLPTRSSHKLGVVPGTPIVYNAASRGGGDQPAGNDLLGPNGVTEIYDLSDPENAVHVQDFPNGYSCHHVFFWNNPAQDKYRAICAGVEHTQIWDTRDPRHPEVIVSMPVHHGVPNTPSVAVVPVAFSHSAGLNRAGTVLYVGDENGGGAFPPGCVMSVSGPGAGVSAPIGAIWFYDISDETNPVLLGWYSAANNPLIKSATSSCTAHHGRLVPDPSGRDLLAMAFYGAGVILVDFTNPVLPYAVDQFADGSNTWESWYHNGYVITGDMNRGLDVLTFR